MRLYFVVRLVVLASFALVIAFGSPVPVPSAGNSITFNGLQMPSPNIGPSQFLGTDCTVLQAGCIFNGTPQAYDIFSATLTNHGSNNWTLSVKTNAPIGGSDGFDPLAFGDALIQSGTDLHGDPIYWGLSLGSYTKGLSTMGDLYEENFLNPNTVASFYPLGGPDPNAVYLDAGTGSGGAGYSGGRADEPVWINKNEMSDVGSSSAFSVTCWNGAAFVDPGVSQHNCIAQTGSAYLYTISDTFNAPASFLPTGSNFSFEVASYVCANGLIIGESSPVPEPRWGFLLIPALLLLGRRLKRSHSVAQQ